MSKNASLELYLNRGLLFVGSTGDPLDEDELFAMLGDRERAASWSDSHVMVRVRAQIALVRVEIWHRHAPIVGDVVFDGIVNLPDGILAVSEFDKINTVRRNVGTWGDHRITVRVDDRGEASRVMVIRDCGEAEAPLTSVPGHELPAVTVAAGETLSSVTELDLILATHDLPLARLAAAIKLLLLRGDLERYTVQKFVEWLRWIHPTARVGTCQILGDRLAADLDRPLELDADERALTMARGILTELGGTA